MIEVIRMIQVVNKIKNDLVVVQPVNVVDRNQNRNHPAKKRVIVQNVVHHDRNQKAMKMVMIEHQIIQKKVQHHRQDVNVVIAMIEITMVKMTIKVAMKVNDE